LKFDLLGVSFIGHSMTARKCFGGAREYNSGCYFRDDAVLDALRSRSGYVALERSSNRAGGLNQSAAPLASMDGHAGLGLLYPSCLGEHHQDTLGDVDGNYF
jgi:hypothetical protein